MDQIVPNASLVVTETYPLFVPDPVYDMEDRQEQFRFLVVTWVFTAWLRKRFPEVDIRDIAMIAGMSAWVPTARLLELYQLTLEKFPGHPKAQLNHDLIKCLDDDFTLKKQATAEEYAEVLAYNTQAIREVDALSPCTCGRCDASDKRN